MRRTRYLQQKFKKPDESWVSGIFMDNLPKTFLANEYVTKTGIFINAMLLELFQSGMYMLTKYNITKNR